MGMVMPQGSSSGAFYSHAQPNLPGAQGPPSCSFYWLCPGSREEHVGTMYLSFLFLDWVILDVDFES